MFTPRRQTPLNYDYRILAFDLGEAVTRRQRERKHCHSVQIGYLESGRHYLRRLRIYRGVPRLSYLCRDGLWRERHDVHFGGKTDHSPASA